MKILSDFFILANIIFYRQTPTWKICMGRLLVSLLFCQTVCIISFHYLNIVSSCKNLVDLSILQLIKVLEAVKNGHEDTIQLLVKNGAKVSMKENVAASILCQAVYDGDITLLRRLVEAGVAVNASDYDKRTGE